MKTNKAIINGISSTLLVMALLAMPFMSDGQRIKHAPVKKPGGGGGISKPSPGAGSKINGGSQKSFNRPASSKTGDNNINGGNKIDGGNNKTYVGNKINIDNSKKNVNINVDNSKKVNINNNRNTVVRHNNINAYHRPPYMYGGRRYYSFHPYFYHPYRPFFWGPVWHPWGFFIATLATTAIIVSVNNAQYHYDQGVWYEPSNGGYTAISAPVGGSVTNIPSGAETVVVNNTTNYYYGGAYYEKDGKNYKVVAPPAGATVEHLPEGGEEVKIGDQTYVKIGETYYQPVEDNKYEVAQVEEGEE